MNFNKTLIATFIGAALASVTLGVTASPATSNLQSYHAAENISSTVNRLVKPKQQSKMSASASGMRNNYDAQLGKTTFQWAAKDQAPANIGSIAKEHQLSFAANHYLTQLNGMSAKKQGALAAVLTSVHDRGHGAKIAKFKQELNGVEVFNREYNVMMDAEFNLVASSGYFASLSAVDDAKSPKFIGLAFGDATSAISNAFAAMGRNKNSIELTKVRTAGKYTHYQALSSDKYQILGEPRAKQVYFESKGKLVAAYYIEIEASDSDSVDSNYYSYVISADSGKVLVKHNLTVADSDFSYRVYADEDGMNKPWQGPHGKVIPAESVDQVDTRVYLDAPLVTLTSGPIGTQDAWLADDATTTQGNNVNAYVDAIAPDGFSNGDYTATLTSANTFDYKYDETKAESSKINRQAAIVNLFYLNNYLHDAYYDHGFDEVSGNAQADNFGRGGVDGDALLAEAQDNSGFGNANMTTPADGVSPKMQMYLFDSKDAVNGEDYGLDVTSHDDLGMLDVVRRSNFGQGQFDIQGDVVRIDDGFDVANDGCEAAVNGDELQGKIALIDRGACNFTLKVLNAQNAGVIGALIANNTDDGTPAPMGGSDDLVKIPNVGINYADGQNIDSKLALDETVSVAMFNDKPFKGSSWDNAIVAHEWGHYISNRLVGGGSGLINQQGDSMGEGWGDFHALLLISEKDDALIAGNELFQKPYAAVTYVDSFYYGIRNYPYSTDMEVNPLTFANVMMGNGTGVDEFGRAEVHDAGEPWAAMLWDSYVALINDERHSFDEARSLMMGYLVAGYKMTPIAPTYTEARDALLAAAYANDAEDYKLILAAFARRGMGLGAVSPERFSTDHAGVIESNLTEFSEFAVNQHNLNVNYEGLTSGYCSNDSVLDKGETGTVSFTINNSGSEVLSGLVGQVEVVSDHDVTFANEGLVTFADLDLFASATSAPLEFTLNDAATADQLELKITFPDVAEGTQAPDEYLVSTLVNFDFESRAPVANQSTDNMETNSFFVDWQENVMFGDEFAQGTQSYDDGDNVGWFASYGYNLGAQTMYLNNNDFQSDVAVETATFLVGYGGDFSMSFWHFYGLEADWDGGVVEISINGDEWVDVTAVGGTFDLGYDGELEGGDSQALSDRPVFTGRNNSDGWGNMDRVDFGSALNGNEVKLRFRIASDLYANDFGWWIDNVTFTNIQSSVFSDVVAGDAKACDNRMPYLTVADDFAVNEGESASLAATASDPNGDELTYSWTQVSGTAVTLAAVDSANATFTAPEVVSGSEALVFELTVDDGRDTLSKQLTVTVQDVVVVVEPEPKKKSSSGGTTGLLALLLLPLAIFRRRK
ncbi:peptidase M36 [Thalassotalea sp. 42_200_T64]|nr:peptidase M36 [Thalassotalea sp. 42_200_T64]